VSNFSNISDPHFFEQTINSLEEGKKKLEEIIKRPALNKEQEDAIKTAKELLCKVSGILSALNRSN